MPGILFGFWVTGDGLHLKTAGLVESRPAAPIL
jgi:hypothetical protein